MLPEIESEGPKQRMALRWRLAAGPMFLIGLAIMALLLGPDMVEVAIFSPIGSYTRVPRQLGLDGEDIYITTPDRLKLSAWYVPGPKDAPVVLWFHGGRGNMSDRAEEARLFAGRGLSLFMVDYRGYGNSDPSDSFKFLRKSDQDKPTEEEIYIDGQTSYDYLTKQVGIAPDRLIIFGQSVGSCVATRVAAENPCAGVILESSTHFGDFLIPGTDWFMRTILKKFDIAGQIDQISAPLLFIHGSGDAEPYQFGGQEVLDAAVPAREFYEIPDDDGDDAHIVRDKEYYDKFEAFVRERTGRKRPAEAKKPINWFPEDFRLRHGWR